MVKACIKARLSKKYYRNKLGYDREKKFREHKKLAKRVEILLMGQNISKKRMVECLREKTAVKRAYEEIKEKT